MIPDFQSVMLPLIAGSPPHLLIAIGRTGDEGIDGIIKEDNLVWTLSTFRRSAGKKITLLADLLFNSLQERFKVDRQAKVFITTSTFTKEALAYVARIGSKSVLIDGDQLAQLMIDHNVGVSVSATYEIKRIDSDYFAEQIQAYSESLPGF